MTHVNHTEVVFSAHAAENASQAKLAEKLNSKSSKELLKLIAVLTELKKEVETAKNELTASQNDKTPSGKPLVLTAKGNVSRNFMLALMEAVDNDQTTLEAQQIVDAKTAMLNVNLEQTIYSYWNKTGNVPVPGEKKQGQPPSGPPPNGGPLWNDNWYIRFYSQHSQNSELVNEYQEQFNEDSAEAQGAESQQDTAVQQAQGQTTTTAQNLQMKAQMVQSINTLMSGLTNLLSQPM